jgi:hypothetical protein
MRFKPNNTNGKGRPKGSPNKLNRDSVINLVNRCAEDLETNFESLTSFEKIKLLMSFRDLFINQIKEEPTEEPRIFQVNIVGSDYKEENQ